MKDKGTVTIFGASGHIGTLLIEYALKDGYTVTAFVHSHHSLPENPNLRIVKGDAYDSADVAKALDGADAVLSALSSWGTPRKDVLSSAMTNIVPAMRDKGIARIVSLTGAEARAKSDKLGIIHRLMHFGLGMIAGKVLKDGEKHTEILAGSGLDWTVVRSPIMRIGSSPRYELTNTRSRPWEFVNRRAVARAMVDQLTHAESGVVFIKQQ